MPALIRRELALRCLVAAALAALSGRMVNGQDLAGDGIKIDTTKAISLSKADAESRAKSYLQITRSYFQSAQSHFQNLKSDHGILSKEFLDGTWVMAANVHQDAPANGDVEYGDAGRADYELIFSKPDSVVCPDLSDLYPCSDAHYVITDDDLSFSSSVSFPERNDDGEHDHGAFGSKSTADCRLHGKFLICKVNSSSSGDGPIFSSRESYLAFNKKGAKISAAEVQGLFVTPD